MIFLHRIAEGIACRFERSAKPRVRCRQLPSNSLEVEVVLPAVIVLFRTSYLLDFTRLVDKFGPEIDKLHDARYKAQGGQTFYHCD